MSSPLTSRLSPPRTFVRVASLAAGALALGPLVATGSVAQAAPADPVARPSVTAAADAGDQLSGMDSGMVAAMKRDLGLDAGQIRGRMALEAGAPLVAKSLQKHLGSSYAGSWIADGGTRLTVATTDRREAAAIRRGGAKAVVVANTEADLVADQQALDAAAPQAADTVRSWYVDVPTNSVVVTVAPGTRPVARDFAEGAGVDSVRFVTSAEAPRTVADTRGGDEYVINGNTLCSVGFAVSGGFVTAGHCGGVGAPTRGAGIDQGSFAGSSFPTNDYAFVRTNANWVSRPWVNNYSGGNVVVSGSQDAAIGSSICRSGRTSRWTCGTLQGRNETINYSNGPVYGMSRMNACANPGDSGGSVISGNQAQGVTSGISGGCGSSNPQTWFQPVNEILGAYGLTLTTSGGGGGGTGGGERFISSLNNTCIDVPNSNFSDGVGLQTWGCNDSAAQRFTFSGGTLRVANNKCMDVAWGSRDNGARIQIATCSGNPAQQFVLSAAGDLVNPQANKCVDIDGWNSNWGARLIQWQCTGGANQKWRRG